MLNIVPPHTCSPVPSMALDELPPHACSPLRGNPTFISTRAHTSDASKLWIFSSGCIENFGLHPTNVRTLLSAGAAIGQGFGEQGCPSVTAGADSKHTAKIVHANPANPALLDGCDAFKARPVSLATSLLSLFMSLAAGACRTAAFPSMLWPSALGAHKSSPRENFLARLLLSPEIDHHVCPTRSFGRQSIKIGLLRMRPEKRKARKMVGGASDSRVSQTRPD